MDERRIDGGAPKAVKVSVASVCLSSAALLALIAPLPALASSILTYDEAGRVATIYNNANACVGYTYDSTGNLASVGAPTVPSGLPTWGSTTWGCSTWHASNEIMGGRYARASVLPPLQ